ncbi:MAG: polysaccharide deacetylase family protein [Flavobacteriales bacterium]|nr:polysaccharide deacetylase family protein [Flavobacteriales bacterium]
MYLKRIPELVKPLFGDLLWRVPTTLRVAYLTFDDGPTPNVTAWVLDTLKTYNAKATFFCVGRHAASEAALMERIRAEGHALGNHTWEHLDGWRTPTLPYLRSVLRTQPCTGSDLFRPPYGHLSREQATALRTRFKVVMWDILSADFDTTLNAEQCERNVMTRLRPGSIIVFHDSLKAWPRLQGALPRVLEQATEAGYRFEALPSA